MIHISAHYYENCQAEQTDLDGIFDLSKPCPKHWEISEILQQVSPATAASIDGLLYWTSDLFVAGSVDPFYHQAPKWFGIDRLSDMQGGYYPGQPMRQSYATPVVVTQWEPFPVVLGIPGALTLISSEVVVPGMILVRIMNTPNIKSTVMEESAWFETLAEWHQYNLMTSVWPISGVWREYNLFGAPAKAEIVRWFDEYEPVGKILRRGVDRLITRRLEEIALSRN